MTPFRVFNFHPIMDYSGPLATIDLTKGYDHSPEALELRGAGGYLERRKDMYTSSLFEGKRFIHMGIDIWGPAGSAVFAFEDGFIWGFRNNNKPLDYGGTIITEHQFNGHRLFALYGHLSLRSIDGLKKGMRFSKGDQIAELGDRSENGGWIPHLHFQLSFKEPSEPDMPGVVSEDELADAIVTYPDPRIVLGPVYL
jgi:murein DD-endopeptidase MepM/ murein hydrolase activator NlpD